MAEILDYDYENFSPEMKKYLNLAMQIYAAVRGKAITYKDRKIFPTGNPNLLESEKKSLSLLIAAFIVDPNLRSLLKNYKEIRLEKFLSFLNIKDLSAITTESFYSKNFPNGYKDFYETYMKDRIRDIILRQNIHQKTYKLTPVSIVSALGRIDSSLLDEYISHVNPKYKHFEAHPLYQDLNELGIITGCLEPKVLDKRLQSEISEASDVIRGVFDEFKKREITFQDTWDIPLHPTEKKNLFFDVDDQALWDSLELIKRKFPTQEEFTEDLFYNLVNNQYQIDLGKRLTSSGNSLPNQRSIIFTDGPTGTGKTAITKEVAATLGIPCVKTSVTSYSATGYVGSDLTDILIELYKKANGDLEIAQRGIVILDEFDKLAYTTSSTTDNLTMKKAVQQQLLDFTGGGQYRINIGTNKQPIEINFTTENLSFVCLGALTDLRTSKEVPKKAIGFDTKQEEQKGISYTIKPIDLESIGIEKELVGRINTYLHTKALSKDDLEIILKESTISPLFGLQTLIESRNKKLVIGEDAIQEMVAAAYDYNTGARGLETVTSNIRNQLLRKIYHGQDKVITVSKEDIQKANEKMVSRKGRE